MPRLNLVKILNAGLILTTHFQSQVSWPGPSGVKMNAPAALLPTKNAWRSGECSATTVSWKQLRWSCHFLLTVVTTEWWRQDSGRKNFPNTASVFRRVLFHMFWKERCLFVAWNPEAQILDMHLVHIIYICVVYGILYVYIIYRNIHAYIDCLILKSVVAFPAITASNLLPAPKSMTIMTELDDNALHRMILSLCNPVVSRPSSCWILYAFNVLLVVKKSLEVLCLIKISWCFWDVESICA